MSKSVTLLELHGDIRKSPYVICIKFEVSVMILFIFVSCTYIKTKYIHVYYDAMALFLFSEKRRSKQWRGSCCREESQARRYRVINFLLFFVEGKLNKKGIKKLFFHLHVLTMNLFKMALNKVHCVMCDTEWLYFLKSEVKSVFPIHI